ncbi:uncharacterized protein LOC125221304 [Salvia hispanica]|uniref:uncharacterized protein LOC125221304 n=1 Tax=Salvia hispanica TaxID=49212 RepID=UPI0020099DA5|nr:uncharacterized protein LOC125221304 [Salvia hispanica]
MRFVDGFQVRDALTTNAIENGWEMRFKRVCKNQVEASCKKPCKWKCYGSYNNTTGAFMLRRVEFEHTCPRNMRSKIVSANWIAKRYLNVFRLKPDTTVKELRADLVQRFAHDASRWKLYNAKRKIIELLSGSVDEHYGKLRSYVLELMRVDKEGRFEIDVGIGSVFKGIYIGFSGLRMGFMMGCRRVIGLDGAFLKTYLGGAILTAVGSDGNNQIFPIAWAVVQAENEVNWKWILSILAEDLNLGEGVGITVISDQQKGLENAVKEFIPLAEHRNCARHVYSNLKKTHKGPTLKSLFWEVVRSTYVEEYLISFLHENVESYVNEYYTLEKYKLAHSFGIPPLNGENMWPEAEGYKVTPPPAKKMPGRPKKMRKRDPLEKDPSRPHKLRKTCAMTCQRCLQQGHNTRSCKNDLVAKPSKEKGKPGRPRKVVPVNLQPQARRQRARPQQEHAHRLEHGHTQEHNHRQEHAHVQEHAHRQVHAHRQAKHALRLAEHAHKQAEHAINKHPQDLKHNLA